MASTPHTPGHAPLPPHPDVLRGHWDGSGTPSASQLTELQYAEKELSRGSYGGHLKDIAVRSEKDLTGRNVSVYETPREFADQARDYRRATSPADKEQVVDDFVNNLQSSRSIDLSDPARKKEIRDSVAEDLGWAEGLQDTQSNNHDAVGTLEEAIEDFREVRERRQQAEREYADGHGNAYKAAAVVGRRVKNLAASPGTFLAWTSSHAIAAASRKSGPISPEAAAKRRKWLRTGALVLTAAGVVYRTKTGVEADGGFFDAALGPIDEPVASVGNTVGDTASDAYHSVFGGGEDGGQAASPEPSKGASPTPTPDATPGPTPSPDTTSNETSKTPSGETPTQEPKSDATTEPGNSGGTTYREDAEGDPRQRPDNDGTPGEQPAPGGDKGEGEKPDEAPDDGETPAEKNEDEYEIGALGAWDEDTGKGTVWHKVMEAAEKNGIEFESEKEKHDAVGRALKELNVGGKDATMAERWEAAKKLDDSFGNKGQSFSLETVFGEKYTDKIVEKAPVEPAAALTGEKAPSPEVVEIFTTDDKIEITDKTSGGTLAEDMIEQNPIYDGFIEDAKEAGLKPEEATDALLADMNLKELYETAGATLNKDGELEIPSTQINGQPVVDPQFVAKFNEQIMHEMAQQFIKELEENGARTQS